MAAKKTSETKVTAGQYVRIRLADRLLEPTMLTMFVEGSKAFCTVASKSGFEFPVYGPIEVGLLEVVPAPTIPHVPTATEIAERSRTRPTQLTRRDALFRLGVDANVDSLSDAVHLWSNRCWYSKRSRVANASPTCLGGQAHFRRLRRHSGTHNWAENEPGPGS